MYERIVVPLDGTPFGEYAVRYAVGIAQRSGAALELVHVHIPAHLEMELFAVPVFHYTGIEERDVEFDHEHLVHEREQIEARARQLAEETGLEVIGRVAVGTVEKSVEKEAEAFGADLIVMSTHARAGLDRARFGSVGDAVVRHATVPVLLVHPPAEAGAAPATPMIGRILVPLDGSEFSEKIVESAARLAALFGAELNLLYVQGPLLPRSFRRRVTGLDDRVEGADLTAEQYLEYAAATFAPGIENPTLQVAMATSPVTGILDVALETKPDLIAMATHGRGGLSRMLLGSTACEVVRHASVPVLLLRPPRRGTVESTAASMGTGHTVV